MTVCRNAFHDDAVAMAYTCYKFMERSSFNGSNVPML